MQQNVKLWNLYLKYKKTRYICWCTRISKLSLLPFITQVGSFKFTLRSCLHLSGLQMFPSTTNYRLLGVGWLRHQDKHMDVTVLSNPSSRTQPEYCHKGSGGNYLMVREASLWSKSHYRKVTGSNPRWVGFIWVVKVKGIACPTPFSTFEGPWARPLTPMAPAGQLPGVNV